MVGSIEPGQPAEFFRELVRDATAARGSDPSEDSEHYLVQLLATRMCSGAPLPDEPLATRYLAALGNSPLRAFSELRLVGDTALFVTGLFLEHVESMLVPPAYFVQLGQMAYQRIASVAENPMRRLFTGLVTDFPELVAILDQIAQTKLFQSDRDTLRTYRRWLATRGPREAAELVRRGVIPGEPSTSRH